MSIRIENPAIATAVASLRVRRAPRGRGAPLQIGLVNIMPDAAWAATERQFAGLLEEAAGEMDVQLSLWTLDTVERQDEARRAMAETYRSGSELLGATQDAIIITGAEPRAPDLREEPYWRELAALFDWAEARTISTIFSCLAAHAAVLHRDGVARRRRTAKCSGLFATRVVARHAIVDGFGASSLTPHSRWNGLDQDELAAKGYRTLTRSADGDVDLFVRDGGSLQVFLHGHPEYDADTLAREYRRDLLRYLRGSVPAPPELPRDYFPPALAARLAAFAESAIAAPSEDPAASFPPDALALTATPWRANSVKLFRNWLEIIADRKAALNATSFAAALSGRLDRPSSSSFFSKKARLE